MSRDVIAQLLLNALKEVADAAGLEIVVQDDPSYEPGPDEAHFREFLLAIPTTERMLGNDISRFDGIYQVDVLTPRGGGKFYRYELADEVTTAFAEGRTLTEDSVNIEISTADTSGDRTENEWTVVSVSIGFTLFA